MKSLRIFLVLAGLMLLFLGLHEMLVSRVWKPQPHRMTCEELGERGPAGNAHVRLVEFALGTVHALHEEAPGGGWARVWIPAFPQTEMAAPEHDPASFRVLVRSDHVKTQADLDALAGRATLDGFVVNDVETLGPHEMRRLEDAYPHTQVDRVWIFDQGRVPLSTIAAEVLVFGGLLMCGIGFWLYVRGRRKRADLLDTVGRATTP